MEQNKRGWLRSAGVALAVAALALVPLAAFLLYTTLTVRPGVREDPVQHAAGLEPDPQLQAPLVFGGDDEPEAPPKVHPRVSPTVAASAPRPASAPAVPARNPEAETITLGMEKAKLLAAYGKPQMVTYGLDNGQPVETFHYLKRDSRTEIIVRLRAGKVASVGTSVY
jgi:hypothetical protein